MSPTPLYKAHNLNPAYSLRYSWTGFPSEANRFPDAPPDTVLADLAPMWEGDGLRLLEHRWSAEAIQMTFSATPGVAPEFLASRAKGRLQNAMRSIGAPARFMRKFSVRSLGDNTRSDVERYIEKQLERGDLADPKYRASLEASTWVDTEVDLSCPVATTRGRYWYNLHLVMVTEGRYRIDATTTAPTISRTSRAVAEKHGCRISALSVMPDHLHIALQGAPEKSPEDLVLAFQNNIAWKLGQIRIWDFNYYVGTFGEYTMKAVRK